MSHSFILLTARESFDYSPLRDVPCSREIADANWVGGVAGLELGDNSGRDGSNKGPPRGFGGDAKGYGLVKLLPLSKTRSNQIH